MFSSIKMFFARLHPQFKTNAQFTILVVDSNAADFSTIQRLLSPKGYRLFWAREAHEACTMALSLKPHLVITEYKLPDMNGVEMCRFIKEEEQARHVPVLFLTTFDSSEKMIECFECEAENFLTKPVQSKVLLANVEFILRDYYAPPSKPETLNSQMEAEEELEG